MMDDAFGHWLAGFIDGEGSFNITERAPNRYAIRFALAVRSDDREIVEEIHRVTGIGTLRIAGAGRQNPLIQWSVVSRDDCLALAEILRRYPLRAKKAYDAKMWIEAVEIWDREDPSEADWEAVGWLRRRLMERRRFPQKLAAA